jgi:hypothetical protein
MSELNRPMSSSNDSIEASGAAATGSRALYETLTPTSRTKTSMSERCISSNDPSTRTVMNFG